MRRDRGQTLAAMMIVLVIILVAVVVYFTGAGIMTKSPRKDQLGQTIPGLARYAAKDEVCKNNLSQLRASIMIYENSSADESKPATLEDTRLGNSMYSCPVGGERYVYDPIKGTVSCPHPGHEKY